MAVPCLRVALCLSLATTNLPSRAQVAVFVETLSVLLGPPSHKYSSCCSARMFKAGGQSVLPKYIELGGQLLETPRCCVTHRARVD